MHTWLGLPRASRRESCSCEIVQWHSSVLQSGFDLFCESGSPGWYSSFSCWEAASTPLGGGRVEHAVGDLEPRLLPGHELDHPFPDWVGAPRLAHAAASAAAAAPLRRAAAAEQVCRRRGPVAAAARSGRLTRRRGRALYTVEALATMDGCARSHRVCFVVQPLQRDEPASLVAPARRSRDRVGESIDRLARLARGG